MSQTPDNLEALRRLLILKRYEQPPPGYFNRFSAGVLARIRAGDMLEEGRWWERLLAQFEAKPILIGAYSVLVCGGLLLGLSLVQMMEGDVNPLNLSAPSARWPAAAQVAAPAVPNHLALTHAINMPETGGTARETSTLLTPNSLFDGSGVKVERASFRFEGQ